MRSCLPKNRWLVNCSVHNVGRADCSTYRGQLRYKAFEHATRFLLSIIILCLNGTCQTIQAQNQTLLPPFEKAGRFIAPDQGLSLGKEHGRWMQYDGSQPFDVLHYDLRLQLAMTSALLAGSTTITMRLKSMADSLVLNAAALQLDTVLVDGVVRSFSVDSASETFSIHLGSLRPAGDTLRIRIAYQRLPATQRPSSRQGYYWFSDSIGLPSHLGYTFSEPSDARFWMPCYDEPWEKATADIHCTVPSGYVAASTGKLLGTTDNGDGTTTWSWREDHAIATYLMCVTASRFTVSTLPLVTTSNDTIPLQYYAWPDDSAASAMFLPTVREMAMEFGRLFGEYPFDKYGMTVIVPFGYLGMEHQTLTTMNKFFATSPRVVSHELAHQWWGDLVTCGTWPDIWLNESFATYSEALWREHLGGPVALKSYMKDTLEHFFFGSWLGAVYNPVGQGFNLFDDVVYSKGAWVLHTLRGVVGDSTFFQILRAYRERWQFQSAVTSELEAVVDSVVSRDMGWFFNQWIYGQGWPKYATTHSWSAGMLTLTIYQQQSASWPTYTMPIQVRAYSGGNDTTFLVQDSLRSQSFMIPFAAQPDSIVLDPDAWILKQIVNPPTDVAETEVPGGSKLFQNYPNPFNPRTTIGFRVSGLGYMTLKVFDLLGREVSTLVDGVMEPGEHMIEFNGENLSSGVYIYRLNAGSHTISKSMLLLK